MTASLALRPAGWSHYSGMRAGRAWAGTKRTMRRYKLTLTDVEADRLEALCSERYPGLPVSTAIRLLLASVTAGDSESPRVTCPDPGHGTSSHRESPGVTCPGHARGVMLSEGTRARDDLTLTSYSSSSSLKDPEHTTTTTTTTPTGTRAQDISSRGVVQDQDHGFVGGVGGGVGGVFSIGFSEGNPEPDWARRPPFASVSDLPALLSDLQASRPGVDLGTWARDVVARWRAGRCSPGAEAAYLRTWWARWVPPDPPPVRRAGPPTPRYQEQPPPVDRLSGEALLEAIHGMYPRAFRDEEEKS